MTRFPLSLALFCLASTAALAAPEAAAPANAKPIPLTDPSRFGPPQAQGEQTAEMKKLTEAGIYQGHGGSLTYLRWKGANPPVVFQAGLWGPQITNEHAALLPSLPELEALTLYEASLDDAAAESLAKLPKLRRLAFAPVDRFEKTGFPRIQWSYTWLAKVEARPMLTGKALAALSTLPELDFLDLRDTRVRSSDLGALASIPKLGEIGLPHPVDAETIGHLKSCKRLGAVLLGSREIKAAEIELLAELPALKRLTLRNAQLSNDTLAALGKLKTITALVIYDCGLTDAHLAHLGKPPSLTQLELGRNGIEGPGLTHLGGIPLKKLDLIMNSLTNASLPALASLHTLEDLTIAYNLALNDEGIQSGALQGMKQLQFLDLRGISQMTEASLESLSQFGHLKQIGIRETKISWESVDKMRAAMPNTRVFK